MTHIWRFGRLLPRNKSCTMQLLERQTHPNQQKHKRNQNKAKSHFHVSITASYMPIDMQRCTYSTQSTQQSSNKTDINKVPYHSPWDAQKSTTSQDTETIEKAETPLETKLKEPDLKDETKKKVHCIKLNPTLSYEEKTKKGEQMRQNVQGYVFQRYFNYIKNYDKILEKNFPSAMKMYRVFLDGFKFFYMDTKNFLKLARVVNEAPQGMHALNRRELEIYMRVPRDMLKVAPALIGCSLPIIGYAIFPLVFMYPRFFLTPHFWTLQQRSEFQQHYLKRRLLANKTVFRCLQSKLTHYRHFPQYDIMKDIIAQIGSGFHPSVAKIIAVKDIFAEGPYTLLNMSRKHVRALIQLQDTNAWIFKRHRLREHAFVIHFMDLAIMREGGPHNMFTEEIRYACYLRGLNPANLSNEAMIEWLKDWIEISTTIEAEHISLYLHLPILLGYNHPNNWQLIYGNKWPLASGRETKKL